MSDTARRKITVAYDDLSVVLDQKQGVIRQHLHEVI